MKLISTISVVRLFFSERLYLPALKNAKLSFFPSCSRYLKYFTANTFLYFCSVLAIMIGTAISPALGNGGQLVRNMEELELALSEVKPGDEIVMANGTWWDADIHFIGQGEPGDSITLRAETPGKVILTGESRIRIGGSYLKVDGLVFRDGYLSDLRGAVIDFRAGGELAHHSRVTNIMILDYVPQNNPGLSRDLRQFWVFFRGTHNRMDHSHLEGKDSNGPTVVVRATDPAYHRIDNNYFGPRPNLGYNGGETILMGVGAESHHNFKVLVEHNLFEECDGEIEIISNKSGQNHYRYNTFLRSDGTLTLRSGHEATVEGNFFLGDGKSGSGGIRITGRDHVIINNYFADLEGSGQRSAISIVNHEPGAYNHVQRPIIAFNTLVNNTTALEIGVRDIQPEGLPIEDALIANNIVVGSVSPLIVQGGPFENFIWAGNLIHGGSPGIVVEEGILQEDPLLQLTVDGLWRLEANSPAIGAASGTFNYVSEDIFGQQRTDPKDIGAEQYSQEPDLRRPLKPGDTGPGWIPRVCYEGKSLAQPKLVEPSQGTFVSEETDFEWTGVPLVSEYQVQIAVGNFREDNILLDTLISGTGFSIPYELEGPEIYRWRVRGLPAQDDEDETVCPWDIASVGPWSDVGTFRTRRPTWADHESGEVPAVFSLGQNYPNPFNPSTVITYGLPANSHVTLQVYDVLGRLVSVLINEEQHAGYHQAVFNIGSLSSGAYFYRLEAVASGGSGHGKYVETRHMMVIK